MSKLTGYQYNPTNITEVETEVAAALLLNATNARELANQMDEARAHGSIVFRVRQVMLLSALLGRALQEGRVRIIDDDEEETTDVEG